MKNQMAGLMLDEGEEEGIMALVGAELRLEVTTFSMVGCFSMAGIVHFSVMKSTMANVWHWFGGFRFQIWRIKDFCLSFFIRRNWSECLRVF